MAKLVPKVNGDVFGCSKASDKGTEIKEQKRVWLGPKSQRKPKSVQPEATTHFSPKPEHIQLFFTLHAQEELCRCWHRLCLVPSGTRSPCRRGSHTAQQLQHVSTGPLSTLCSRLPSWTHLLPLALSVLSEGAGIDGHITAE